MGFDIDEITNASLYMKSDDGSYDKLCDISDVTTITEDDLVCPEQYELNKKYTAPIFNGYEGSLEYNIEQDLDIIGNIFGIDMSKKPDAYDIVYSYAVQVRKHKKKRINKKWAKKYGYKIVHKISKGWVLAYHEDGTFEFVKEYKND